MNRPPRDKSTKIPKYRTDVRWSRDYMGRAVFSGHVMTPHGIVGVEGDFRRDGGYTRLDFVYMGRLYTREYAERYSTGTIGRAAREFAQEMVEEAQPA